MKKSTLGRLITTVCAMLAFVLVFSFAACDTSNDNNKGLTLQYKTLTIDAGTSSPLLVTSTVTQDVVWTSSNESVATIEGSGNGKRMGKVTAVSVGTAVITAKSGDESATCNVTVVAPETVSVKQNGNEVTSSLSLSGKDATLQLSATSSRGHNIKWESSKPLIASVSNSGLVTAVAESGTVQIIASCKDHSDVKKSIEVVIGSGKEAAYDLKQGDENAKYGNYNSNDNPGVWVYWNQYNNVSNATYDDGVVTLQTTGIEDGAVWHNVQLFYTATAADTDTAGNAITACKHYQLTFDIETTMAGHVTVNGYVLTLQEGVNHCTAYYDHTITYGSVGTAFGMQLGVEGSGCDITNATIKLSNIKWTVSEKVNLVAPSFTITDNVISITDTNPAGSVGSYTLNLYDGTTGIGGVTVKHNTKIDTSKIRPNGTYTGKLVANAANAHYITAPETTSAQASVTVNNTSIVYTMVSEDDKGANALKEVGTWTYWTSWWCTPNSGSVTDDVATISFNNNTGFWYDIQMFYKVPGKNVGDTYSVTLHIDNVPNAGKITVNGQIKTLTAGNNTIALNITETSAVSVEIIFGELNAADHVQEITSATNLQVYIEM